MKKWMIWLVVLLAGCIGKPDGIEPVKAFQAERYLGKWYEIARLDHRFERGLSQVSAEYSVRDDGGIKVVNRGYDAQAGKWKESVGKAYFVDSRDLGYLKVSFFGPFYGSYVVFDLDEGYRHSLVTGPDRSYFWFLSRSPQVDDATRARLLAKAASLGFDTSKLIVVQHEPIP